MKSAVTKNEEGVRVLKVANAPSLSGRSKLTYHIGSAGKDDIRFRVVANSASGAFCPQWLSLEAIEDAFERCPKGEPLTGAVLERFYRGRSANSGYFLMACLRNEGLIRNAKDSPRGYERLDTRDFVSKVQALRKTAENGQEATKAKNRKGKSEPPRKPTR